jgi:hypothetical protein
MMQPSDWKVRLLETVQLIADQTYQEEVWLRGARERQNSSWEEIICRLFDDYDLDGFLQGNWRQAGVSQIQHDKLVELRDALNAGLAVFGNAPDPAAVLNSLTWQRIRKLARETLSYFESVEVV